MSVPVYLSTGAFTGRKNNRDYKLAIQFCDMLDCDGYELLIFEEFYPNMSAIIGEYRAAGLNIPVIHAEKSTGDLSGGGDSEFAKALELFKINCDAGRRLGSEKIVLHAWGYPHSDSDPERTCGRLADFIVVAGEYGLDLLVENIVCARGDPLALLRKIHSAYPALHFLIDTRHAQFHRELEKTLDSEIMGSVRHLHIGDFSGGYKEWGRWSAGLQPGQGDVDWPMFFSKIKSLGYKGSITVESASIMESGVDTRTLNAGVNFVRAGLK